MDSVEKNSRSLYVVINHIDVATFGSQKVLLVTDILVVWTTESAAKA